MSSSDAHKSRDDLLREIEGLKASLQRVEALQGLVHELQMAQEEVRSQNAQLVEAHRQLELSRDRYADLWDFAPTPYLTFDKQGVVLDINVTGCELLGVERSRILGQSFIGFIHPDDRGIFRDRLITHQRWQSSTRIDLRVQRAAEAVPVELTMIPVHGRERSSGTIRAVIIDMTERIRSENERQDLRTREAAVQAASEAKDRFLAMVSHELRTPLAPILAIASTLVRNAALPRDVRMMLEMIQRNIHIEEKIINDLLDMSRASLGKLKLSLGSVDAHALVGQVVETCAPDIRRKNIRLNIELLADQHWVQADGDRLRQVLWNLLANAIKFTPDGRSVVVRTSNDESANLQIEIIDNGIGISPQAIDRIFAFYEQEDRDRGGGGLGLGLGIAKALVEAQGGQISAASAGKGDGATFRVTLPAIPAPIAPRPAHVPEKPVAEAKSLRILLVEDHADTAFSLAQLLEMAGHQVAIASSVKAAISHEGEAFDCLISDLDLPDGSGLDVMRHLRDRGMRGIAVSGFGSDEDVRRCREAGFKLHLTKPVDFTRLIAAVEEVAAV